MARNQLANVRINNVLVASYLYDHRSLRGRKTLSNPPAGVPAITLYTYDPNGHLFQEIAGSGPNIGQALVTYLWQDDVPAAIVLGPNTPGNPSAQDKLLYLEVDHLNTPRIARDKDKNVVWRWDSDAFGNTAPNEDPDGDGQKTTINLRFPGQYFDAESGLHYNWHRYYDPQVGRYTQPDPIGVEGGVNPYAYAGGNPGLNVDPNGLRIFNPYGATVSDDVLDALSRFNQSIGCDKDIVITGGDRKATSKLGAGSKSMHVQHLAADIRVRDQTHLETASQARLSGLFGGIGWYEEGYAGANGEGPHVHVDIRPNGPAVWGFDKRGKQYHGSFPTFSPDRQLNPSAGRCGCE